MSRRRFFVPRDFIRDGTACLPADQAHHLRDVLRIRAGDAVEIFDGAGNAYAGDVAFREDGVRVCGLQPLPSPETRAPLILAASLIKSSKFEWILQKATELGVREIVPLRSRRSEIDVPGGRTAKRVERWDRIVQEASRQCGRSSLPRLHPPRAADDFFSAREYSGHARALFYERASEAWDPVAGALRNGLVLCVGPEGGWTEEEVGRAQAAGYGIYTLGPWILRAETAAIAAVSVAQHRIHLLDILS